MVHDGYVHNLEEPITLGQYFTSFLSDDFREYQEFRMSHGLISVNLEKASSPEQLVHQGDYISSLVHYHERPVLDEPIEIIHEDDSLVVVNKPASMVIHPQTGYRLNSLVYIMAKEKGYMNLRPAHRLDKLTSGVMIFSKVTFKCI